MNKLKAWQDLPKVERRDVEELASRIEDFRTGREDEERFKHFRLTRGVYGQRQQGVQMFRLKIPAGRLTAAQLAVVADLSDQYATGNLHLTTRQNIQLHFVKLENSPAIWAELARAGMTAREACGNTVRNLTASANAGIDPEELFDVTPYVLATFRYFLRNPICQEMGRKIKPAFSSSDRDSGFTFFHDFGFIPRLRTGEDGQEERGFKVVLGGGLGAVSMKAYTVYEFLPTDQIIPYMEACLRVFDRHGEREKRMKARMKFLIQKIGLETFLELVEGERGALPYHSYPIAVEAEVAPILPEPLTTTVVARDDARFALWKQTNVFAQRQPGFHGVYVRVPLGDIHSDTARAFAKVARRYAADDIRITVNQGLLLRYVRPEALPALFNELDELQLALPGFDTLADITACPGTDTCALGVTNSTGLAEKLEELVWSEYQALALASDIRIKISGCMNSCGQHMAAQIGFHGSSIRHKRGIIPAMQVVLGGGLTPDGRGFTAEKIIKLPTKRILEAVRWLLNDFSATGDGEPYNDYVQSQGKDYFYQLLKPLADVSTITDDDFADWGDQEPYVQSIGVGECAGVVMDVVASILADSRRKLTDAGEKLGEEDWSGAIYLAYQAQVTSAKALLLSKDVRCNTHQGILDDFQTHYVATGEWYCPAEDFSNYVLKLQDKAPRREFAEAYVAQARIFTADAERIRAVQLVEAAGEEKEVVREYYEA